MRKFKNNKTMVTKDNPGGDPGSGSKPTGTDTPAGDGTTPGQAGDKGTDSKDQLYTKDQVTDLIHREIGKVVK